MSAVVFLVLLAMCGAVLCNVVPANRSCIHKGVEYAHGASVPDPCNVCGCGNGNVWCTMMACIEELPPVYRSCTHKNVEYAHGETFYDSCNTCSCGNGAVGCTRMGCPEDMK